MFGARQFVACELDADRRFGSSNPDSLAQRRNLAASSHLRSDPPICQDSSFRDVCFDGRF